MKNQHFTYAAKNDALVCWLWFALKNELQKYFLYRHLLTRSLND